MELSEHPYPCGISCGVVVADYNAITNEIDSANTGTKITAPVFCTLNIAYSFLIALSSASLNTMIIGIMSIPQKKLLIP